MGRCSYFVYLLFLIYSLVSLCHCQTSVYITEPKITSIVPVNSTALTINWQFADSSIDQSSLIRIYITILEYYTKYNTTTYSANFTSTASNKTVTSWTQNFPLVNAFYSVCFSTNSTITNVTYFIATTKCQLAQTCSRQNSSNCPNASAVNIQAASITSNSFLITVNWYNVLPITRNSTLVQISSLNSNATYISLVTNDTYNIESYQFSNLQARTTYVVTTTVNYLLANQLKTETYSSSVTTSRSAKLFSTSDILLFGACILSIFLIKRH
ncbi:unnamed protein product [Adineta ricciae]|uniref:Fibronectin type-III domain-containing protein n=1 Tax=Adineta ricciae TaxID=249248 RepID=A0A813XY21_ADIRI|nr:unnamed protein product [Adineta ricciae]CAF1451849.1 unnamed protein product [Adineta ricciae]